MTGLVMKLSAHIFRNGTLGSTAFYYLVFWDAADNNFTLLDGKIRFWQPKTETNSF
jgi:hypothetical protein